jgi:carboxypeptidase Taq
MSEKLEQLKTLLAEVADLHAVQSVLSWDQQTYMPQAGGEARGNQLATVSKISHQKFTSDEIGNLLGDLEKEFNGADRLRPVTTG